MIYSWREWKEISFYNLLKTKKVFSWKPQTWQSVIRCVILITVPPIQDWLALFNPAAKGVFHFTNGFTYKKKIRAILSHCKNDYSSLSVIYKHLYFILSLKLLSTASKWASKHQKYLENGKAWDAVNDEERSSCYSSKTF